MSSCIVSRRVHPCRGCQLALSKSQACCALAHRGATVVVVQGDQQGRRKMDAKLVGQAVDAAIQVELPMTSLAHRTEGCAWSGSTFHSLLQKSLGKQMMFDCSYRRMLHVSCWHPRLAVVAEAVVFSGASSVAAASAAQALAT